MSPLPDVTSAFLAATVSPLPSGDFYIPLQIAAFDAACRSKAHLYELPDFPSLPASRSLLTIGLRIIVPSSLRLTRFDCSVNLLEPQSSCSQSSFTSNEIFNAGDIFLKILLA
jgi:hypothetical protein